MSVREWNGGVVCDIDLIFEIWTRADYWLGLLWGKCSAKQVKTNLPPPPSSPFHPSQQHLHNISINKLSVSFYFVVCVVVWGSDEMVDIIDIAGTIFSSPWEDCVFGINWCSSTPL